MAKRRRPVILKRSEIRKSVRKPAVRPSQQHPNKTKRPPRGRVREQELE
jgi:hypothetical protein